MTARIALTFVPLVLLILIVGCHKAAPPREFVCLLDISQSIYPEAVINEFAAMDKLAEDLRRGDELVIIPIASNARNDVQGHIVHLRAPQRRAAFDTDLVAFHREAHEEIVAMKSWAISHPSAHTDILGTLQVAQQEINSAHVPNSKLILLSDFLEDDDTRKFVSDQALVSAASARRLADGVHPKLKFTSVFLGRVRSREGKSISMSRSDAVDAFWGELLRMNKKQNAIHTDGIGALSDNADAVEP